MKTIAIIASILFLSGCTTAQKARVVSDGKTILKLAEQAAINAAITAITDSLK